LRAFANDMLAGMHVREQCVQDAWRDVRDNGGIEFPERLGFTNIFNAPGRWGTHATALMDALSRGKYFDMQEWMDNAIQWFDLLPDFVSLDGLNKHAIWTSADLAAAMRKEKDRIFGETEFTYTNSAGEPVKLSLLEIERRMYDLSFDPNHPPEIRWGAKPGSEEAKAAPEMPTLLAKGKTVAMDEAFKREAYYRTLAQREPDETSLRQMFTEGFPIREKFDARLESRYKDYHSPPLVPHNGKLAQLRAQRTWALFTAL
jgi:hypothetical protein